MLKKFVRTMAYIGGIATGFYLFASAPFIKRRNGNILPDGIMRIAVYMTMSTASRRIPWRHFVGQWIKAMALNWMFI